MRAPAVFFVAALLSISSAAPSGSDSSGSAASGSGAVQEITFGMGCFFAAKKQFDEAMLVARNVRQGYAGGFMEKPDFKSVMRGKSGHAQVLNVEYEHSETPLKEILAWFWSHHDPTSINRQGEAIGSQYRSIIFFRDAEQNMTIHATLAEHCKEQERDPASIVTEILPHAKFWPAEDNVNEIAPEVEEEVRREMEQVLRKLREEEDVARAENNEGTLEERESRIVNIELARRDRELEEAVANGEDTRDNVVMPINGHLAADSSSSGSSGSGSGSSGSGSSGSGNGDSSSGKGSGGSGSGDSGKGSGSGSGSGESGSSDGGSK